MKAPLAGVVLWAVVGVCLASGGPAKPQPVLVQAKPDSRQIDPADFQGALTANRAKWAATGIKSYVLKERRSCFCTPQSIGPFDIIVINEEITSVEFSDDSGLTGQPQSGGLLTIDGAFERIQELLNRSTPIASLSVTYNALQGYIESYSADIDVRIADEEQAFTFELVRVIPTVPVPSPTVPKPKPLPGPGPSPGTLPPVFPFPPSPPGGQNGTTFFQLNINRAKWNGVRPDVYVYKLVRGCFCPASFRGPFIVTVTKGAVTNVVLEGQGQVAQNDIPTITGLFDFIAKSLTRPNKDGTVEVDYDPTTGVPKKIVVDRAQIPVDGGVTYTAEVLKGLPGQQKTG